MLIIHVFKFDNHNCGFGDFIRGSLTLSQVKDCEIAFDFSNSALEEFFINSQSSEGLEKKAFQTNGASEYDLWDYIEKTRSTSKTVAIGTNYFPLKPIENKHRQKVIKNLQLKEEYKRKFDAYIKTLPKEYAVLHIRIGDEKNPNFSAPHSTRTVELSHEELSYIFEKINTHLIKSNLKTRTVILSDRMAVKKIFSENGYVISNAIPVHTSVDKEKNQLIENTLLDFYILSHSSRILQYSNYFWGSGFSQAPAILYNIPFEKLGPYGLRFLLAIKESNYRKMQNSLSKKNIFISKYALHSNPSIKEQLRHHMTAFSCTPHLKDRIFIGLSFAWILFLILALKIWFRITTFITYYFYQISPRVSSSDNSNFSKGI